MRMLLAATLVVTTGCSSTRKAASTTETAASASPFQARVDALARPFVDGEWYPGIAIALVHDGTAEFLTYGTSGGDAPVKADTVFEVGSVSKVFTSLILSNLVETRALKLDDPVQSLLPEGTVVPSREGHAITLEQLSTHTSGLPRMPDNFAPADPANPYADYDATRLYAYLAKAQLSTTPGEHYAYSNLGAGLLAHALTLKTGRTYDQLLVDGIAAPLGMTHTRAVRFAPDSGVPVALGHDANGDVVRGWDFDVLEGAGCVRSSLKDMARFAAAALHPPESPLGNALRRSTTLQPSAPEQKMGLGWHVGLGFEKDGSTRWHNGQTDGFHTFIALDEDRQLGVVVLANEEGMKLDALGSALLLMLRGQPYAIELPPSISVDSAGLAAFVGSYALAPGVLLTVTQRGPKLLAQLTGQRAFRIFPDGKDHFHYRVVPAQLTFERDERGNIVAVKLAQNGQETRAPRQ